MTHYLVLKLSNTAAGDWNIVGEKEAPNAEVAISAVASNGDEAAGGDFVAIPSRSWHPVRVEFETRPKLTLVK